MLDLRIIVQTILEDYVLPLDGTHGVIHWARVYENGLRIASESGANIAVVELFAVFHDAARISESDDPEHGFRGAELAKSMRGEYFELPDDDFDRLFRACAEHTDERTHPDVSVQTCWDADRLDLGRVGAMPELEYLCTPVAKRKDILQWADGRASFHVVPDLVLEQWGVTLDP